VSVTAGGSATFSVVANGTAPLTYQWSKGGVAISGATSASYTIASAQSAAAGSYAVVATNSAGSATSNSATLSVTPAGPTSWLSNVAVRTTLAANQILIVGLTMQGGAKPMLIRAVGPGLTAFGITRTMADPKLAVFNGPTQIAANDNWSGNSVVSSTAASVGAFGLSATSLDAALVATIDGGRTVQVSGPAAGNVIVEAYDAGTGNSPRLTNLSALNRVGTGADILIAGFSIAGTGTKNLLIRAAGPSLAALGVSGTLADPVLAIFNSKGVIIDSNDTYAPALASVFTSVGAFAFVPGAKDAALTVSLPPGGYTVQVAGTDGGTGTAIVEVYELP
jgi:hypothetical protein